MAAAGRDSRLSERSDRVSAIWVVAGIGGVAAVIAFVASREKGGPHTDLGTVSTQWISEHRLGSNQDSRR
jgi:hypothetical protein